MNLPVRGRRGGGRRGGRSINFKQIKEAVQLVEVNEPKVVYEPTINDVELIFTQVDYDTMEGLPEIGKKLYIVLRKCHKIKRFDILSSKQVSQLLEDTEKEVPELKPNTQAMAICTFAAAPDHFYLQWQLQEQRMYLLKRWIQDMVAKNKLDKLLMTETITIGTIVVAQRRSDDLWVRGQVTRQCDGSRVSIFFMDYGDQENYFIDELYSVSPEIAKIPPMCFVASLTNVQLPENYTEFDWQTKDIFSKSMAFVGPIECSIAKELKEDATTKYAVRLQKLGEDGQQTADLGELTEQDMLQRLSNLKVVAHDPRKPTVEELDQIVFDDSQVNVHIHTETTFKGMRSYRFLNIISPDEFYLEYVSDSMDSKKREWMKDLQNAYHDPKYMERFKIKTPRVFKNRCYVWHNSEKKMWYRARVIDPDDGEGKVQVWLLDLGKLETVSIEDMRELDPKFACWDAMAFKAHLVDVKPVAGALTWPEEVSIFLKEQCSSQKLFHSLIINKVSSTCASSNNPVHSISLGMILAEKFTEPKLTVQAMLVERRFADGFGPSAGRHDLAYYLTAIPSYDQFAMHREFELGEAAEQDSENVTGSNTSKTGQKAAALKKTAVARAREQEAYLRGNLLNGPEESLTQKLFRSNQIKSFRRDEFNGRDLVVDKMQRNMGCIVIPCGAIQGACRFYIQMRSKSEELEQMEEDLEKVLEVKSSLVPEDKIVPGLFAAVQVLNDQAILHWARVVVKTYLKSIQHAKIILIDYGLESSAKTTTLSFLPKYFEKIPPFCHRAHLDMFSSSQAGVKVLTPSAGNGWPTMMNTTFQTKITQLHKKEPYYYAWQYNPKKIVPLEEFNQRLRYDTCTESWFPEDPLKKPEYAEINARKDHPLLANFFTSIGIDIVYDDTSVENSFYKFVPVWKLLTGQGAT